MNLKDLFTQTLDSFADDTLNYQRTQLLLSIEANYDDLSNNRFANSNDFQAKRKKLLTSISGSNKIMQIVARYNPNK